MESRAIKLSGIHNEDFGFCARSEPQVCLPLGTKNLRRLFIGRLYTYLLDTAEQALLAHSNGPGRCAGHTPGRLIENLYLDVGPELLIFCMGNKKKLFFEL